MNAQNDKQSPVSHQCDFCKTSGLLNQTLFNHAGWYYCQSCLAKSAQLISQFRSNEQTNLFAHTH